MKETGKNKTSLDKCSLSGLYDGLVNDAQSNPLEDLPIGQSPDWKSVQLRADGSIFMPIPLTHKDD